MTLTYTVQFNSGGIMRFKAEVPAKPVGIVGDYHNGTPYQPDTDDVRAALPHAYRRAFDRAALWWQQNSMSGRHMPLMRELYGVNGKPLGTLFATPNWVA
jgi:hypothetical protein